MPKKRFLLYLATAVLVFAGLACTCSGLGPLSDLFATSTPTPTRTPTLTPTPTLTVVGTWEGDYQGSTLEFTFESNGTFTFYIDGYNAGDGTYDVNYSTDPMELDLYYSDGMNIYTIITFQGPDTMQMENAYVDEPRPTRFSDYAILYRTSR